MDQYQGIRYGGGTYVPVSYTHLMYQMSIPLVISVGLTYVLLLGSIDLSIEGVMGFAGSFVAF